MTENPRSFATPLVSFFFRGGLVALAATVGAFACSAPEPGAKDIGSTAQAYAQASCPSTPDAIFMGAIGGADDNLTHFQTPFALLNYYSTLGYLTPATYNNPHCSKSRVVQITGWLDPQADFVVTGKDSVRSLSQADCESLYMAATIYGPVVQAGATAPASQIERVDGGHFTTGSLTLPGGQVLVTTFCSPPKIVFGGFSWRQDDWDLFAPGQTYTIAATYRTTVGSSITTHAMSMYNAKAKCGKAGEVCCTANENYPDSATPSSDPSRWKPWCAQNAKCDSGLCNACGQLGQEPCETANSVPLCQAENLIPLNGSCVECGRSGQPCCFNVLYPHAKVCSGSNLACMGSTTCLPIAVTPPPPPPPAPITGIKCNGQQATTATMAHVIMVQNSAGCGGLLSLNADSDIEAAGCAHAQGYTNLAGSQSLTNHVYCVCGFGGVSTVGVPAYSDDAANTCVVNLNQGDYIWPGACTVAEEDACENF